MLRLAPTVELQGRTLQNPVHRWNTLTRKTVKNSLWLTEPCFEKKLYGYEGFGVLQREGYKLIPFENDALKRIGLLSGLVGTCNGCTIKKWDISYEILEIGGNIDKFIIVPTKFEVTNKKSSTGSIFKISIACVAAFCALWIVAMLRSRRSKTT